ncbi:MAG: hypothetical protein IT435_00685 [Phycisphaerales bacterium]|nr:hypothetical protein [Phycisphaerales bacterium]
MAALLREEGIVARAFDPITMMGGYDLRPTGAMVLLLRESDRQRADQLIKEFEALPPAVVDPESLEAAPDFSRLDDSVRVACPACGSGIRVREDPERCPSCREPVDVVALAVEQLGPEAIAGCYGEPAIDEYDELADVPCLLCGYALIGLPRTGVCPECAARYDKDEVVQRLLGDLGVVGGVEQAGNRSGRSQAGCLCHEIG